jgi:hypothetical protein
LISTGCGEKTLTVVASFPRIAVTSPIAATGTALSQLRKID